ncbi:hypothetical protein H072_8993 [Dactylellina haptotyla CBS 200.50]|uniref:GPI anchored protein n=1 Tax=Dactylellina haptotyla (strain CBS 200.50) TaxID=1284197 RepID=S8A2X9_DACHA|nr:hypothetical protein H072_8993 [Dactylellina haptotyla CBS 200.50]
MPDLIAGASPQPRLMSIVAVAVLLSSVNILTVASTVTSTARVTYTLRLPPTAKYYPKDVDDLVRQYAASNADSPGQRKPVMKLFANGGDEGQKYYNDFDSFISFPLRNRDLESGKLYLPVNAHLIRQTEDGSKVGWTAWFKFPREGLEKRQQSDASCPSGNSACTNILKPGYCCPTGTSCVSIQDTGFGAVGCCPNGQPCGDSLSNCAPGYNQCPQGSGGGCCLPGYICSPQGCLINTSGITPPTTVTTTGTITVGLDLCQGGYYPCPASLSYGCCQIGYLCGVTNCPFNTGPGIPGSEYATSGFTVGTSAVVVATTATTTGITYPTDGFSTIDIGTVNPASVNTQPAPKITDAPGAILSVGNCPGGWLACGPQFNNGCCRVGRDCGVNYCPVGTGTGSVNSITTVTTNGACPGNWFECPASLSGGCCPTVEYTGYDMVVWLLMTFTVPSKATDAEFIIARL